MQAQLLTIEERTRFNDVAFVQPSDFRCREAGTIDAAVILSAPNLSLYCLDPERRRALFVETDADVQAAPFLYQAQYAAAQRLIGVPYEVLHALADRVVFDHARLLLIYSVGRCGSTVVSRALRHAQGVVSLSEPDVYSQLQMLREADRRNEAEISALLRSCTHLYFAAAANRGGSALALKFRSFGIELSDLFLQNFPRARSVFLYRGGAAWARSVGRAFGFFKPEALPYMPSMQEAFARIVPLVAAFGERHARTIAPTELLACMWTSAMQRARSLQQQGVALLAARYEDTQAQPRALLSALFEHCGIVMHDAAEVERVLAEDAQAGTSISRDRLREQDAHDDGAQVAEVCRLIPSFDATLTADSILPRSFLPTAATSAIPSVLQPA